MISMDMYSYNMVRRYAMEYGTFLGALWFIDFLLMAGGINGNVALMVLGGLFFLTLWIWPIYFAYRFKQHLPVGEQYSMVKGAYFALMLFVFAEVLCFMCEFAYFAFIDKGQLVASIQAMLGDPLIAEEYAKMGLTEMLETSKSQLDEIASLKPFDLAISLMGNNILTSVFLFIPTMAFASMKSRHTKMPQEMEQSRYEKKLNE